jgi:NAD+ synthase
MIYESMMVVLAPCQPSYDGSSASSTLYFRARFKACEKPQIGGLFGVPTRLNTAAPSISFLRKVSGFLWGVRAALSIPFDAELAIERVTEFLRSYVRTSGMGGVVIGLSGGLDSSVACALAVRALGPSRVHGLIMPDSRVTPIGDVEDAKMLAEMLGIEYHITPIDEIYDCFSRVMSFYSEGADTANANLRARIRMVILYYYANLKRLLVCGSGDKSEIMLGYFTKYGDGAADILPLGDIYKTQVRRLAKVLGLPSRIAEKPSSPRLLPGQLAEEELGAKYDEIDQVLYLHFERGMPLGEVARATGISRNKIRMIVDRVRANEHKRGLPPIPKIR